MAFAQQTNSSSIEYALSRRNWTEIRKNKNSKKRQKTSDASHVRSARSTFFGDFFSALHCIHCIHFAFCLRLLVFWTFSCFFHAFPFWYKKEWFLQHFVRLQVKKLARLNLLFQRFWDTKHCYFSVISHIFRTTRPKMLIWMVFFLPLSWNKTSRLQTLPCFARSEHSVKNTANTGSRANIMRPTHLAQTSGPF